MAERILLVDDDAALLRMFGDFLLDEQFVVETASNGPEALRQAYRVKPDLVVLDVNVRGMDGWETCARLRELSDVPIILMMAKSSEADVLRGFRMGVDDFVARPFSFAEVAARIRAVLTRSQASMRPAQRVYRVGDLVVDLDRRRVLLDGKVVDLTPTEFRLLSALVQKEGQAVPDETLAQEAWGSYKQEAADAVRRYIWLLRQKIEDKPSDPNRIVTVRGYGYRLATGRLKDPGGGKKGE